MKSQKGSVTVIALIMLLFLVVLCGGWIVMMTQEKTNAFADEKQQQAWYAAEAGYKRAAMLINGGNSNWDKVSTSYADIKSNKESTFTKLAMDLGTVPENGPWYAFSISNGTTDLASAAVDNTTYTITSVGEYMGERKVISRTYKKTASSGGGGGATSLPGVIQTGGKITTFNAGFGKIEGQLYAKKGVEDGSQGQLATGHVADWSTYTGTKTTKVPNSIFKASNYSFTDTLTITNQQSFYLEKNKAYYLQYNTSPTNRIYEDITAESGATLFLEPASNKIGNVIYFNLKGPTSGEPLTIIMSGTGANHSTVSIWGTNYEYGRNVIGGVISGRVRIIADGTLTIDNSANFAATNSSSSESPKKNLYMILCNNNIYQYAPLDVCYLSGNSDVYMWKEFQGVVLAKGNVEVHTNLVYDNTVSTDKYFTLPEGMIADWN
jgi:Tfp pilus assembly protein PilX